MKHRHIPVEADCDICGQPLDPGEISRNYQKESGNLTCESCSQIRFNKHHEYND